LDIRGRKEQMDGENYAMSSFDEEYASSNSIFTVKSRRLGHVGLQKEEKFINSFDRKPEGRRLLRIFILK
jgi:hypothetical protein